MCKTQLVNNEILKMLMIVDFL